MGKIFVQELTRIDQVSLTFGTSAKKFFLPGLYAESERYNETAFFREKLAAKTVKNNRISKNVSNLAKFYSTNFCARK